MRKINLTILVFVLTAFSTIALLIAACPSITIFFSNGMNNTKKMAQVSLEALEGKLQPFLVTGLDVNFRLAYNHKEDTIPQLVEVVSQKVADNWKSFWSYFSDLEPAPDWFQDAAKDIISATDSLIYVVDSDLQTQVDAYIDEIENGRRVIVVAHSQGNFYANAAYGMVNSDFFNIIAVASPASYVAGNGPHITLTDDYVINGMVRPLDPSTLSAEITNNTDNNSGWTGHDFNSSYLEGDVTGPLITENINNLIGDTSDCVSVEDTNSGGDNNSSGMTADIKLHAWCAYCTDISASFAGGLINMSNSTYGFKDEEIIINDVSPGVYTLDISLAQNGETPSYIPEAHASVSLQITGLSCPCCMLHILPDGYLGGAPIITNIPVPGGTAQVELITTCPE